MVTQRNQEFKTGIKGPLFRDRACVQAIQSLGSGIGGMEKVMSVHEHWAVLSGPTLKQALALPELAVQEIRLISLSYGILYTFFLSAAEQPSQNSRARTLAKRPIACEGFFRVGRMPSGAGC